MIQSPSTNETNFHCYLRPGLCQAIQYILRAKECALAVGGPPCSSVVFINMATSKRSADSPFGDQSREYVRNSNKLLGAYYKWFWCLYNFSVYWWWPIFIANGPWLYNFPRLTTRWALLLLLCAVRSVFTVTEQPSSSTMHHLPYIKFVIRAMKKLGLSWGQTFLFPGYVTYIMEFHWESQWLVKCFSWW